MKLWKIIELWLRSFLFNVSFFFGTVFLCILFLPFLALPRRMTIIVTKCWINYIFFLLKYCVGITYEVRGPIPKLPVIIASKHQSAFETFVFHKILPPAIYLLKQELTFIPLVGWYLVKAGMISIKRNQGSIPLKTIATEIKQGLLKGCAIIIFPEGTRTLPGVKNTYKSGISLFYKILETPIVPVALNSGLFWGRRSFLKKPGTIIVEFLSPISPGLDPKVFLQTLEDSIETKSMELSADFNSAKIDNNAEKHLPNT